MSGDCEIGSGIPEKSGYKRKSYKGKSYYAHRLAWIMANGEIPKGFQIHHRCGNRECINLDHLEMLNRKDHIKVHGLKGWGLINANKTHCNYGHLLDGKSEKQRYCLECKRQYQSKYRKMNKDKINTYKRMLRERRALA